jgi:hypothetical protein
MTAAFLETSANSCSRSQAAFDLRSEENLLKKTKAAKKHTKKVKQFKVGLPTRGRLHRIGTFGPFTLYG